MKRSQQTTPEEWCEYLAELRARDHEIYEAAEVEGYRRGYTHGSAEAKHAAARPAVAGVILALALAGMAGFLLGTLIT